MVELLFSEKQILQVRELLSSHGLNFDDNYDSLMGIHGHSGELIATGARSGYTLKMIAVANDSQSTDIYSELITELINDGYRAGHESMLIFTKPSLYSAFTALNFHLLSVTSNVALLEYGAGIRHYLNGKKHLVKEGRNGAVIMNCNPFTKGHQYLAEQAASMCDHLYVFVVEEDSSSFPFNVRYRLVREGTAHLDNVTVLTTGYYAVSRGTFPSYFISEDTDVLGQQIETDLNVFARHLAPFFNIKVRFAGNEPYCGVTATYNRGMKEILPAMGLDFEEIERVEIGGAAVSASKVRKLIMEGDKTEALKLLPPSTAEYIESKEFENDIELSVFAGRH